MYEARGFGGGTLDALHIGVLMLLLLLPRLLHDGELTVFGEYTPRCMCSCEVVCGKKTIIWRDS